MSTKLKPKTTIKDHGQNLATFEQLPEETKELHKLKEQEDRTTGPEQVEITKKIEKKTSQPRGNPPPPNEKKNRHAGRRSGKQPLDLSKIRSWKKEHKPMKETETPAATPAALKQRALERWENEGGEIPNVATPQPETLIPSRPATKVASHRDPTH